ncbi:MAG: DUF624 domain-containing protein [Clostridia bacterium]|nr:DUF624 domain-containing protein [Clostridia bacterium]
MNFLKVDSPFMEFLRKITDILILNIICFICCIPIVTIGAALTAKYYVAMKLSKDEESGVVVPFFVAFKDNFKQSTLVWLFQMVVTALVAFDWVVIFSNGLNNVEMSFKLAITVISAIVMFVNMSVFPMIARFKLSMKELYKATVVFIFTNFIKLLGILALLVTGLFAAVWFTSWFPLILIFCTVTVTYFLARLCDIEFKKYEALGAEDNKSDVSEDIDEVNVSENEDKEVLSVTEEDSSYAASRKELKSIAAMSDLELNNEPKKSKEEIAAEYKESRKLKNRVVNYFKEEKEKISKLNRKQKFTYFMNYYAPELLVALFFIGCACWYFYDVYKANQIVISGTLINCNVSEEGKEYLTEDFIEWADLGSKKKASLVESDIHFQTYDDSTGLLEMENAYYEDTNQNVDAAFLAQISAGYYDYLIMDTEAIEYYVQLGLFADVNTLTDVSVFDEDHLYYYSEAEEAVEISDDDDSISEEKKELYNEIINDKGYPVAIKLDDNIKKKIGISSDDDYYIAFVYSTNFTEKSKSSIFVNYLFGLGK